MKNWKNYLTGILIGLLLSSPVQALGATLEDETIRCLFFGFAVSALRDRYSYNNWDDWLDDANKLAQRMMVKRRGWHKPI